MDKDKAFDVFEIKEFTLVNDCFKNESNAVFVLFLQRIYEKSPFAIRCNLRFAFAQNELVR